jgi:hypothetical protein
MAKGIAMFVAALFALVSLYGFWFHASVGPSHGPGMEIGIVAGAAALVAGTVGISPASRDNGRPR